MGGIKNPFNPDTRIPYQLAEQGDFKLAIYGSDGKEIRTFYVGKADGNTQVGLHRYP